ncbi:MAG: AAC(3) family N-acetyltransferase [Pseudomonadota bacterium]
MKEQKLFKSKTGDWVTCSDILFALDNVKAADSDILYMHTGMTFGLPNLELSRQELLAIIYELIDSLSIQSLLVPVFTFSFCNQEGFNRQTSSSKMGALNEFIRKLPQAMRSIDPLMSSVLIGKDRYLVEGLGKHSIGKESTFDKLHSCKKRVKFLFLGTTVSECFTYTHYVESLLRSPYRYDKEFTGKIIDEDSSWIDAYSLFVRYEGVIPATDNKLEKTLLENGSLLKLKCGDSSIACVSEPDAFSTIIHQLEQNEYAYINFDPKNKNHYFNVKNMVAL